MNIPLKNAFQEYNDAYRMFEYAVTTEETDIAIAFMHAAEIKIGVLKRVEYDISDLQPISEDY